MSSELRWKRWCIRIGVIFMVLAGGFGGLAWLFHTQPQPVQTTVGSRVAEVQTQVIEPKSASFPVVGHGTVRPKRQLNIIPQVSGKLTYVHPDLAQGRVIHQDDVLFEIDPTVYESRLRQAEAEVRGLEAAAQRERQELQNLAERIEHARQMAAIDDTDFKTSKELHESERVGTQRDVDLVYQKYLRSKDAWTELESRRTTMPHLIAQTEAQLDAARARLTQAQHDWTNTRIVCPFKARVESTQAVTTQVVTAFFSIATLTDLEAFELAVGIDPRELRWLQESIHPNGLEKSEPSTSPEVAVYWSSHGEDYRWPGHVSRFERVDEVTRTARMVVEVRDEDMLAGGPTSGSAVRSSLSLGMFCRAELPGKELNNAVLIPRSAIYDDRFVYVVERDAAGGSDAGRLAERRIALLRSIEDSVLVDYEGRGKDEICELQQGDLLITSPLEKPIVGMPVRVRKTLASNTDWYPTHNLIGSGAKALRALAWASGAEAVGSLKERTLAGVN